ncbi:MAG: hypothetical protein HKN04_03650 [Rhodothermaceae bacterium]|nr:hypothetical protein [Rhodothermaceae bacterium]
MFGFTHWPRPLTPRHRQAFAREIEEELRAHLALRTEDNLRAGMAPDEAEADAHRRFGDVGRIQAACLRAEEDHPVRVARRLLAVGGTLTIGFGLIALIVGLVYTTLLSPLRFDEADRLVRVGQGWDDAVVPHEDFAAWRAESTSFDRLTTFDAVDGNLTGEGPPERFRAMLIDDAYFEVFGVEPLLGRVFEPNEVGLQAAPLVVLSEALWARRYHRDPLILGREVILEGHPYVVIGVMPEAGQLSHRVDLWAALPYEPGRGQQHYVAGRLRPGVTLADARAEIGAIADRMETDGPGVVAHRTPFYPMHELYAGPVRPTLLLLLVGAVALLFLVWAITFRRVAARAAQDDLLDDPSAWAEPLGVAVVAALLGLALARGVREAVVGPLFGRWGPLFDHQADGPVVLAVLVLGIGTGIGLRWVPRLSMRLQLPRRMPWIEPGLVAMAVAAAVLLLAAFGQQLRPSLAAGSAGFGFDEERVLAASIYYPVRGTDPAVAQAAYASLLERVGALPGVEAASVGRAFPYRTRQFEAYPVGLDAAPGAAPRTSEPARFDAVAPGYFTTMGISLLEGRAFSQEDEAADVAVINESFARRSWPGESALGRRIDIGLDGQIRTVVGVVGDVRYYGAGEGVPSVVYVPHVQVAVLPMELVVRTRRPEGEVTGELQAIVREASLGIPAPEVRSVAELHREATREQRTALWLLGLMALVALAGAIGGTVQLVADPLRVHLHGIERQQREELPTRTMLWQVWLPALRAVGIGAVLGIGLVATLAWGVLPGLLGEMEGLVMLGAAGGVAAVILAAGLIPAWHALGIAPVYRDEA